MPDSPASGGSAEAPKLDDPAAAVAYLERISPELRGCAILDSRGQVVAATGEKEEWAEPARELLAAADAANPEPIVHAHVATGDAEAFCVRHRDLVAVAVAERFVLSSLMAFDIRAVLRELAG